MRKITRSILATTAVAGLLALPVAGASADGTSDTTVTFTVDAAGATALTISQASASSDLGSAAFSAASLTSGDDAVSGTLPATTVTDARGQLLGGWSVDVVADGDWENQADSSVTVPATGARAYFNAGDLTELTSTLSGTLAGMTITGAELVAGTSNLATSYELVAGTTTTGDGDVTYTPAIEIEVPEGTPAGTYEAVVTQTLS